MLVSKEKCIRKKEGSAGERAGETKSVRGFLFMLFLLYFETGSDSP